MMASACCKAYRMWAALAGSNTARSQVVAAGTDDRRALYGVGRVHGHEASLVEEKAVKEVEGALSVRGQNVIEPARQAVITAWQRPQPVDCDPRGGCALPHTGGWAWLSTKTCTVWPRWLRPSTRRAAETATPPTSGGYLSVKRATCITR